MLNKIKFTEETGQYRFKFLNGEIVLPNEPGGYVMATGCGAGKTTAIRQIMLTKFGEGILYSAATKKECDEMYDYLVKECTENILESRGLDGVIYRLTPDKILNVHSEPRLVRNANGHLICTNGINTSLWENHPEKVAEFHIVICTHHKLLHENPYTFMRTNFITRLTSIDLITQAIGSNPVIGSEVTYPRQWLLVDELPTCEPLKMCWEKTFLNEICDRSTNIEVIGVNNFGENIIKAERIYTPPYRYDLLKGNLINAINNCSSVNIKYSGTKSDELQFDIMASIIHHELPAFIKDKDKTVLKAVYNISKLIINNIDTKLILFDGTGDLTQLGGNRFKVLTYDNKYNSPLNIIRFKNHQDRLVKINKYINEKLNITSNLNDNITELQNIIDQNDRTLIVTWKNLKSEELKITKSMRNTPNLSAELTKFALNDELSLPEYYKNRLVIKPGKEIDIIHYQSGLDKATNQFRDYDTIVFLGKFQVPGYVVKEFNELYGCSTDLKNYTTYQLVQAVCRTRIRKHQGEPINIYFSSDWSESTINDLVNYISYDTVRKIKITNTTLDHIKPKWRSVVEVLGLYHPEFRNAIETKSGYRLEMGLDEAYDIIPMSRKEVIKYYPLIRYLRTLGIELVINSNKSK